MIWPDRRRAVASQPRWRTKRSPCWAAWEAANAPRRCSKSGAREPVPRFSGNPRLGSETATADAPDRRLFGTRGDAVYHQLTLPKSGALKSAGAATRGQGGQPSSNDASSREVGAPSGDTASAGEESPTVPGSPVATHSLQRLLVARAIVYAFQNVESLHRPHHSGPVTMV